jgi:hypothetical protein
VPPRSRLPGSANPSNNEKTIATYASFSTAGRFARASDSRMVGAYIDFWGVAFVCIMFPPVLLVIAGLMVLGTLVQHRQRNQLRALAASRPGESLCSFARGFDYRNTDTWIVRAVYEELQKYLASDCTEFPIRPDDRLAEDLRIDNDDLELDLAKQIAERTGRSLKDTKKNSYYGNVKTVRDLVGFFLGQ